MFKLILSISIRGLRDDIMSDLWITVPSTGYEKKSVLRLDIKVKITISSSVLGIIHEVQDTIKLPKKIILVNSLLAWSLMNWQ
jgi:hypothetical protein